MENERKKLECLRYFTHPSLSPSATECDLYLTEEEKVNLCVMRSLVYRTNSREKAEAGSDGPHLCSQCMTGGGRSNRGQTHPAIQQACRYTRSCLISQKRDGRRIRTQIQIQLVPEPFTLLSIKFSVRENTHTYTHTYLIYFLIISTIRDGWWKSYRWVFEASLATRGWIHWRSLWNRVPRSGENHNTIAYRKSKGEKWRGLHQNVWGASV